jgi:hypothetical protein
VSAIADRLDADVKPDSIIIICSPIATHTLSVVSIRGVLRSQCRRNIEGLKEAVKQRLSYTTKEAMVMRSYWYCRKAASSRLKVNPF